jgi:hypothetical protein
MPFKTALVPIGAYDTHSEVFKQLTAFLTGVRDINFSGGQSITGYGYGELTNVTCSSAMSTAETITIAHSGGTDAAPTFSVTGSSSGSLPPATGGVAYSSNGISFLIRLERDNNSDGNPDIAYASGDTFTFEVVPGTLVADNAAWVLLRDYSLVDFVTGGNHGALLKGLGSSGTDEIFISITTTLDIATGASHWEIVGALSANLDLSLRGTIGDSDTHYYTLWNGEIEYYFVANGRRFIVGTRLGNSGVTTSLYAGLALPAALPSEYPYPLVVGASSSNFKYSHDSTDARFRSFYNSDRSNGAQVLRPDNTWYNFGNSQLHNGSLQYTNSFTTNGGTEPWANNNHYLCSGAPNSNFLTLPGEIFTPLGDTLYLDGVYWVNGRSPLASFDTLTDSQTSDNFVVVSNNSNITLGEFAAFLLE